MLLMTSHWHSVVESCRIYPSCNNKLRWQVSRRRFHPCRSNLPRPDTHSAVLVGVLPEDLQLSGHSLLELTQPTITAGMSSQLLSRRPDVHEAEANLIAANADIRVARSPVLPFI